MKASTFFNLPPNLPFEAFFKEEDAPWQWVQNIQDALKHYSFFPLKKAIPPGVCIKGDVFIHDSVQLPPYAVIEGPAYIDEGTEIRPGAYVRGNVIVGSRCILGNACEYKNCLLMNGVQTPHYNYIGDSILGSGSHLGAGVILANLRLDQKHISIAADGKTFDTGMRKLGAILGENVEVGCNAVLQPGTVLGKRSWVMSTLAFGGYLEADTIVRGKIKCEKIQRRK